MPTAKAVIQTYRDYVSIVPIDVPNLSEVREFAARLHAEGKPWQGEVFGWQAEYNSERQEPPLDSKLTFTPADFCIGESGIWFYSLMWERGRHAEPVEFLDDKGILAKAGKVRYRHLLRVTGRRRVQRTVPGRRVQRVVAA